MYPYILQPLKKGKSCSSILFIKKQKIKKISIQIIIIICILNYVSMNDIFSLVNDKISKKITLNVA